MWRLLLAILLLFLYISPVSAVSVTISGLPASVGEEEFTANVAISGAGDGTNYLRFDLYKEGTTNYFGETDNGSYWYNGSDGKQYTAVNIASGSAIATLRGRLGSPSLTDYPGPGSYKIRVRRYTGSGNQASSDSQNSQDITLTKTWPSPSPSFTPSPTPTPTPSPSPTPTPTPSPSPTPKPSPRLDPSPPEGTVAGETVIDLTAFGLSPSPSPALPASDPSLTLNRDRAKVVIAIGSGLVLLSLAGILGYRRYRQLQGDAL